jgi:hypothetical protein
MLNFLRHIPWLLVAIASLGWWCGLGVGKALAQGGAERFLAEGDRLADAKDYAAAVLAYKDAYERIVPQIREREFKKPVNPKLMSRSDLKAHMAKLLAEDITEAEMLLLDRGYKALGLVPPKLDVKETLLNLLTEEVAGFYNPKDQSMYLIKEEESKDKKGVLDFLFGSSEAFNKDEQKMTLAHEMAHALQDQHFDLQAMDKAVQHDDDMILALQAVVEGEAMLVMFAEMVRDDTAPQEVLRTAPGYIHFAFTAMKAFLPVASGKTMKSAPPIFRESLLFPYHRGTVFLLHGTNRSGWKAVDQAFTDPPTSTEQIIHPDKYFRDRDVPTQVDLPDLQGAVGSEWQLLGSNTVGELQLTVMLAGQPGAEKAGPGWDGDHYAVFENDQKQPGLVWLTTWDSARDAQEFARCYRAFLGRKLKTLLDRQDVPATTGAAHADDKFRQTIGGRAYHVECREKDVAIVEGFTPQATENLVELAFSARKSEKVFRRPDKK